MCGSKACFRSSAPAASISGSAALAKVRAGATLLQLYSALVFRGLGLVADIKSALVGALERHRFDSLAELTGVDAAAVTAEPWPD